MEINEDYSDTVEVGMVISSSVKEGEVLRKGQRVVLTVSIGKQVQISEMPNLLRGDGISKVDAERMLNLRGFKDVTWIPVESKLPAGTVVSQSVDAGAAIDINTPIIIEYSNGIRPLVTIPYTFTGLPLMEENYVLTIMCGDETVVQAVTIFPGQNTYTVTLTGREPTEYIIYVNWNYYTTVTVEFE